MDTRLWGGPLGILRQQYTTVHNNTPQSTANDASSSDEELDYHKLVEKRMQQAFATKTPETQASPAQSPSVVVTPPRLNAAGYGDEVPSPSPVAWPSAEGRTFGRDATPSSAMGSLQIDLPPPTSFSNLSHPLTSPLASPLTSPAVASLHAGDPVIRQLMTPPQEPEHEEEPFTFSSANQHCSPLRVGKHDAAVDQDATPFARDGWDAAVRQQQQLGEAVHVQGEMGEGDAIRAAGFGWGEGKGAHGEQLDAKRKASETVAPKSATSADPAPRRQRRINMWLPATVVILMAVAAPLPHRQLLADAGGHALQRASAMQASAWAMSGAWIKAAQHHAAVWKQQAWEYGDMVFDALAQSGDVYHMGVSMSRTWARSGPVISWQRCSKTFQPAHQAQPVIIPEIEDAQAAEQAKQWDNDLQGQLQRAGYLATRLVRWHAPSKPVVPASPPLQLPTPPTPLDATPAEWDAVVTDDALQALIADADEVFATDDDHKTTFEKQLRALPRPVKRVLRAGVLLLQWHIALVYWTALGALGASIAAAALLTACRALPLSDQEAISGTSWRPVSAGSSVFASMPHAARQVRRVVCDICARANALETQVSAVLSRSVSASLSAFGDHTWLRPNVVVARAGARGASLLYRWLRNRVVILPGLRHLAAARGRELGDLLRQLTPSSPMFGLAQAAEAVEAGAEKNAAVPRRKSTRRTPATPAEAELKTAPPKSAPRSSARRKAAVVAEDSPAAGTRSATRRAARA